MGTTGNLADKKTRHGADDTHAAVVQKMVDLYHMLVCHSGFGEMSVDIRILKCNQKEVIVRCGKQYRYVVDKPGTRPGGEEWLLNWKHDEDGASCLTNKHTTPGAGAENKEEAARKSDCASGRTRSS